MEILSAHPQMKNIRTSISIEKFQEYIVVNMSRLIIGYCGVLEYKSKQGWIEAKGLV